MSGENINILLGICIYLSLLPVADGSIGCRCNQLCKWHCCPSKLKHRLRTQRRFVSVSACACVCICVCACVKIADVPSCLVNKTRLKSGTLVWRMLTNVNADIMSQQPPLGGWQAAWNLVSSLLIAEVAVGKQCTDSRCLKIGWWLLWKVKTADCFEAVWGLFVG